jgi:hypothetical protein
MTFPVLAGANGSRVEGAHPALALRSRRARIHAPEWASCSGELLTVE